MAQQTTKEDLKKYFETGDKPNQNEYAELIDAFRHVDEKLPIADVENLETSLDAKASAAVVLNHINDNSLHSASMTGAEIKTAYESEADTNAFTDAEKQQVADSVSHITDAGIHISTAEKQQVADGVAHRADTNSHVSNSEKSKWNNQLSTYVTGEVLSLEMGNIFRIYNGGLYEYTGDFPNNDTFTTASFSAELAEIPTRWKDILSTFPPVEFAKFSPTSIPPNTTKFIQLDAANIRLGTTIDFGPDISVLNYQYITEKKMLIEIQSNANLGDAFPKINNGREMTMSEQFSISNGEVFVPGTTATQWSHISSNITYSPGSWVSNNAGGYFVGIFSEILEDTDFELNFKVIPNVEDSNMYVGFKTDPNNTSPTLGLDAFFRVWHPHGLILDTQSYIISGDIINQLIKVKRVVQSASTYVFEVYLDDVLSYTSPARTSTGTWYPYFYTGKLGHVTDIELTIF